LWTQARRQTPLRLLLRTTGGRGSVFDGITRHTAEGYAFQQRAAEAGFREAVRERDDAFGDHGASSFKG
jgi:enoyl-CoA hydratase